MRALPDTRLPLVVEHRELCIVGQRMLFETMCVPDVQILTAHGISALSP